MHNSAKYAHYIVRTWRRKYMHACINMSVAHSKVFRENTIFVSICDTGAALIQLELNA